MALLTTTIGSFPNPEYVALPDWFRSETTLVKEPSAAYERYLSEVVHEEGAEALLDRATREAVLDQVGAGIDVPTDGEIRRENYIHYHCRHLAGFDFSRLNEKVMRAGTWQAAVPTITAPIEARAPFLPRDWRAAQSATGRPVKITIPGPLTIADSTFDEYYGDEARLGRALSAAINAEIKALSEAGCTWVQVDEPVFAREPEKALAYGIENLERCFVGTPDELTRVVHICCGYPDRLDNEDYPKADPQAYFRLAPALDRAGIDVVSIEDAHRQNDLSLLEQFTRTRIILGVVAIARSRVESQEEIEGRLAQALGHIEPARLVAGPDCGLGMLDRKTAVAKLKNLAAAAHSMPG